MKTLAIVFFYFCVSLSATAQTSNLQTVKGWTRTHVVGVPGGTLLDPSGKIADNQRLSAVTRMNSESSNIVSSAHAGFTNAMQRLYDALPETNRFVGRVYLSMDLDDDPDYSNIWAAVIYEFAEPDGTLHELCYYSRMLAEPPKTIWEFDVDGGTPIWSTGITSTNNALTNVLGYACYDIMVPRPSLVGNVVLRTNKYLKWGAPSSPLNISDAGIAIAHGNTTNYAFTGAVIYTNAASVITETYLSGFLFKQTTNSVGGI